jgi:hypothetical protein
MKVFTDFKLTAIRHLILQTANSDDAELLHLADKIRKFSIASLCLSFSVSSLIDFKKNDVSLRISV